MLRVPRPRPTRGTGPAEKVLGRPAIWPVRSPGGVLAGPVRSSGRPPWPPSGGPHPRQGPAGAHLSSAVPPPESPPGVRGGEVCPNLLQRPRSRRRRNVDIPRFFSQPIPARGAFATDLDMSSPRTVPGVPRVPPGRPALHRSESQRGIMRHITPVREAHWSWKERAAAKTSLNRSAASASAGESSPSSGLAPMNQARTVCGESVTTSSR